MADCVAAPIGVQASQTVVRLWSEIERRWAVGRSHPVAPPHLSLAVVLGRPSVTGLAGVVSAVAARHRPLRLSAAGYGVFAGAEPVVHLAVTRSPALTALHEDLVDALEEAGLEVDPETRPEFWRPHVNLADLNLDPGTAGRVIAFLLEEAPQHWSLEVGELALLGGPAGGEVRSPLG